MLDLDRLRINVTSGRYVVDAHAVADALLSHAGITSGALGVDPAQRERRPEDFSPQGADSRTGREPRPRGC